MPAHKLTELSMIKLKLKLDSIPQYSYDKVPTLFQKWNSRTFQGLSKYESAFFKNYRINIWCKYKCVILQWNNVLYTKLQYSLFIFQLYNSYNLSAAVVCITQIVPWKTWITRSIMTEIWWKNYWILLFFPIKCSKCIKNAQTDKVSGTLIFQAHRKSFSSSFQGKF